MENEKKKKINDLMAFSIFLLIKIISKLSYNELLTITLKTLVNITPYFVMKMIAMVYKL